MRIRDKSDFDFWKAEEYLTKGRTHKNNKDYARAIEEFSKAIRLCPNYGDAYWLRCIAYKEKGEFDLAIQDADWLIQQKPDRADFYSLRAELYEKKGNHERADEDHKAAARIGS